MLFSVILFSNDGFQARLNYLQILLLSSRQRDFFGLPVGCIFTLSFFIKDLS